MLGERVVWISKILIIFIFINDYIVRKFDILLDEMFDKLFYFCISYVCCVNVV